MNALKLLAPNLKKLKIKRGSGGIGRHNRLKICRALAHAGSSPAFPTKWPVAQSVRAGNS